MFFKNIKSYKIITFYCWRFLKISNWRALCYAYSVDTGFFCSFPSQQCSSYLSLHPTTPPLMATFAKLTKRKYYNSTVGKSFSATAKTSQNFSNLKGGYPIIFASNVFHNSHLIQKCIQYQHSCCWFCIHF